MPRYKTRIASRSVAARQLPWGVTALLVAVAAGGAVAAGAFEQIGAIPWYGVCVAGVLVAAAAVAGLDLALGREPVTAVATVAQPLLWAVVAEVIFRAMSPFASQVIVLPALLLGAFVVLLPPLVAFLPLLLVLAVEAGLALNGHQGEGTLAVNGTVFLGTCGGCFLFTRGRVYCASRRGRRADAHREAGEREYARDLGFADAPPPVATVVDPVDETDTLAGDRAILESVAASFDLQLEIIRRSLALSTVALFWAEAAGESYKLRAVASCRDDIVTGPFAMGAGILGILNRSGQEVILAPLEGDYGGLPYYGRRGGVGGVFAAVVPDGDGDPAGERRGGVLCADRAESAPWQNSEIEVLRLASRKLGLNVAMGRRLLEMDRERAAIRQVCVGLRELNGVLDLASAFDATVATVQRLLAVDFVAISLKEEECHRVVRAEGRGADAFRDCAFCKDDGLVGQALAKNRTLPTNGVNRTAAPIFSSDRRVADFKSLLIVPLRKEVGEPIGALVVAARAAGAFSRQGQEILELIATQMAVKIDLARAHDEINRLATTDGLTGLANHRTFQHAFEVMLERARRQQRPLCLLLCDIDHFKGINDTFGHPFGDRVLQAVAGVLGESVRQVDLAARYGGEEFVLVLEDADERGGIRMAERIRAAVAALTLACEQVTVTVTLSLGLSVYPTDATDKAELLGRADQALYRAKGAGRNRTVVWSRIGRN